MPTEPKYEKKLSTFSEIDLVHEQEENFTELAFLQVQLESAKKEKKEDLQTNIEISDYYQAIVSMRKRIAMLRRETERRDALIARGRERTLPSKRYPLVNTENSHN